MKVAFILLIFVLINQSSFTQKISFSFGTEVNQTRFRQYAPLVNVPFNNSHNPGYGISTNLNLLISIKNSFAVFIMPNLGYYNTKSNVTSSYQMNTYGLRIGPSYRKGQVFFDVGIDYSRLHKIIGTYKNIKRDMTFFAHRRNFFGPTLSVGYKVLDITNIYIRSTYFLKDFFSSGALDYDGNIVGPVEVTPYIFALGAEFNLSKIVQNSKDGKYRKKK